MRCSIDSISWTKANNGINEFPSINALTSYDDNVYAGATDNIIYKSTNMGEEWSPLNLGNPIDSDIAISCIVVNKENIFVGTNLDSDPPFNLPNGIYRSTDSGLTWATANNGLTDLNITDIAINDSLVVVGTDSSGVFISKDNGDTWSSFNTGLPNSHIYSLGINDDYLYVGIFGGVWRCSLSDIITSVNPKPNNLVTNYSLSQNYPNPFNPTTTIEFAIPNKAFAKIVVYNLLGEEVKTLLNEQRNAGRHSVQFDGSSLSSGIYYYRLVANEFIETKKLVLIK